MTDKQKNIEMLLKKEVDNYRKRVLKRDMNKYTRLGKFVLDVVIPGGHTDRMMYYRFNDERTKKSEKNIILFTFGMKYLGIYPLLTRAAYLALSSVFFSK